MSLDGLGLPRLSRSYGSESSSAPSYSERSFSYQDSPTAPTRRQPTLDVPQEVENVPSTDEYCKACSAGTDPVRQASCKLLHDGEDQRVWIQANGEKHCCGHQHRTLVLCFDGTGDQFDDSVREPLLVDVAYLTLRTELQRRELCVDAEKRQKFAAAGVLSGWALCRKPLATG